MVSLAIRLGILAFLAYWSYVLIRPFVPILIWSVILAAALYPVYTWLAKLLGDRSGLAAALVTALALLVVVGPATWLGLGLVDGLQALSKELGEGTLLLPPPPEAIKSWPVLGGRIYEAWALASTNLDAALRGLAPQLRHLAGVVLGMAGTASAGILNFLVSVVVAGFLFMPGPRLVQSIRTVLLHIVPERSDEFVSLAGATIRSVSRGIIGIAVLQSVLIGIGFRLAGVPGASVWTVLVLVLGILQIGSAPVVLPVLVWCWTSLETSAALLFTAYIVPMSLLDNILKPMVMARGLKTPTLIIFIGVIGGTLAHGVIGLFIGPIVLAVAWELLAAWSSVEPASQESQARTSAHTANETSLDKRLA